MIKLSKRLMAIASLIDDNLSIIDIGCDHGLLDIYLINNRSNISIIANDINKNAIENVKRNIKKYNSLNIDVRLGNGLDIVDANEIDTIVISGMGTYTIIDIFESNKNKLDNVNNIIIQSNNNLEELRRYITSIGYYIDDEILVEDNNIIYTVIRFKKGIKEYNDKELFLGPILLKNKDDLFYKLSNINKNKLVNILHKLPIDNNYYDVIKKKIDYYNEI